MTGSTPVREPIPTRRLYPYRPALDGLRALAVTPVMLYHAQVGVVSGGFLGVDLFFVISGYLITTLLLRERAASGTIRLRAFWARRARRLFPALLALLAAVLIYGLFASALEVARMRGDVLATLGYVSNWWFAFSGESYFEGFGRPSMLRHTWSLAIEEQFYIVWPLLLFFGLRRDPSRRWIWIASCGLAALASAALMVWLFDPGVDPSRVYYGTDSRAQALLVGAVLAFALDRGAADSRPRAVSTLGLLACLAFFVTATDSAAWMYRGGYLALAIASACAIVAAVQGDASWTSVRLLSARPLVWIGARSYGLYLWHWPLFVLLDGERLGLEAGGWLLTMIRFAATFAVAAVSYRWIEAPVRAGRLSAGSERFALIASPAVVILGVVLVTAVFAPTTDELALSPRADGEIDSAAIDPGALRVLFVGDSVAMTLAYHAPRVTRSGIPLAVRQSTMLGCGILQGDLRLKVGWFRAIERCAEWPKKWQEQTERFEPDASVILIGAWEVFDRRRKGELIEVGSPEFAAYLKGQLETGLDLLGGGERPVFLLTAPCYNARLEGKLARWSDRNDSERRAAVNAVLRSFAAEHPESVTLLDLQGFVCPTGEYQPTVDGVELHRDGVHYTAEGAQLVWDWLLPSLEAAVERPFTRVDPG